MNWLDIVIVAILVIPTLIGSSRGLIKTIFPLAGVILSVFLAGQYYGSLASWLSSWLESPSQAKIVAFAFILVAVIVVATILSSILHRFLRMFLLGWVDKLGGAIFGLAIGGVISGALVTIIAKFFFSGMEAVIRDSSLATFFLDHFPFVLYLLPEEFDAVRQFFD